MTDPVWLEAFLRSYLNVLSGMRRARAATEQAAQSESDQADLGPGLASAGGLESSPASSAELAVPEHDRTRCGGTEWIDPWEEMRNVCDYGPESAALDPVDANRSATGLHFDRAACGFTPPLDIGRMDEWLPLGPGAPAAPGPDRSAGPGWGGALASGGGSDECGPTSPYAFLEQIQTLRRHFDPYIPGLTADPPAGYHVVVPSADASEGPPAAGSPRKDPAATSFSRTR